MALARIRRTRIDELVEDGNRAAVVVQQKLKNPNNFIAACQLGITMCTLALGAVGEHTFAVDLARLIVNLGVEVHFTVAVTSCLRVGSYVAAFCLTVFMQTVFGELIPKTWTFQRAESVMMTIIWPMEAWCWLTAPINRMLNGFTDLVLKLLRVKDSPHRHYVHSEEELKLLVSASQEEGVLEQEEEEMLHSVFDFSDTVAQQVMTPRTDMVCLSADATIGEFVNLALEHGYSRLPVFEEDMDSIFGMVHIRDGLRAIVEHKANSKLRELVHKVLIVPETKDIGNLLTEFRKTKTHVAIVVDEYGSTRGLVTIEDLLEELVGDIADEHEIVEEYLQEQPDGSILLDARISLSDVSEKLNIDIEEEQYNTLGGHVFGCLGREPKVGDKIGTKEYTLLVEEADRHRIIRLRLIRAPFCPDSEEDGTGDAVTHTHKSHEQGPSKPNKSSKSLESST